MQSVYKELDHGQHPGSYEDVFMPKLMYQINFFATILPPNVHFSSYAMRDFGNGAVTLHHLFWFLFFFLEICLILIWVGYMEFDIISSWVICACIFVS